MKRTNKKQKPLTFYFKIALFSFLLLCIISILLIGNLFFDKSKEAYEVYIPSFVGKGEDEIYDIHRVMIIKDYIYSDTAKKDEVIYQSHTGKKKIPKDGVYTLGVTVSLGKKTVIVPNLAGMTQRDAQNALNDLGVRVDIEYVCGDYDSGRVLYHIPKKNSEIMANGRVTLYISRSQNDKSITVPEFEGMNIMDAITLAQSNDIIVGDISYVSTEDIPEGYVLSQSLPVGIIVKKNSKINFKVSKSINYNTKDRKESRVKLWMDRKREE